MKLKRIVVALAAALVFAPALAVPDAVKADETEIEIDYSIPDPVFAQYLKDEWDRDKDGILTQSEMNGVTEIRISNKDIVTLSGISYFHNIETISLYNCDKLQEVQLDNFPRLEELDLRDNNNSRFRIILTNCPNVTRIDAYRSSLRQIYLNDCPNLEYLDVSSSAAEVLREVTIAACPKVVKAYVESTSVFEGQYYKDYRYIEGDDITYYFSSNNNCNVITEFPSDSVPITPENFPDFYFRRMLLMYYDNWDGFLSPTEVAKVKEIDFSPMPVSDIKGVEFFTELTSLTASMGTISEVDLSHNTKLTNLDLQMNNISSIDLSHNTKLEVLYLQDNNLSTLDVSMLPNLRWLFVSSNNIRSLHIHNNPEIIRIYTEGRVETHTGEDYSYKNYKIGEGFNCTGWFNVDVNCNVYTTAPTPIPTPTTAPAAPSTPSSPNTPAGSTSEGGVAGFVERLYTVALGRASEPNGKAAWIAAIRGGESGAEVAKGFLFSDEFLNKNMSNADFVTTLYRVFFDRQPDAAGHAAWVAALERGESKQDVIMGFINSTEWANVCVKYGIRSGGTGTANITIEPNESVVAFATRLYTTCLKRTPDQNGLRAWALQLANLRDTGTNAAHGFFFSDEMNNNPVSNEEFVTRLYLTFMDRQPDQGGMNAWVGQLNSGVSREEVFQGFAASDEFGRICANYGIIR